MSFISRHLNDNSFPAGSRRPGRRTTAYLQSVSWRVGMVVTLSWLSTAHTWAADEGESQEQSPHFQARAAMTNCWLKLATGTEAHVAFMGGSITEMNGYRPMVEQYLTEKFPETEITFTNAGIASTCSTTGAIRLESDVFAAGEPDLLFVEFAVNDDQDAAHTYEQAVRGMEGILRQVRKRAPHCDVAVVYFCNPSIIERLQAGDVPLSIAAHEQVVEHYQVPTVLLAQTVAEAIEAGSLTWEAYGGTHPGPVGNRLAADGAIALLEHDWAAINEGQVIVTHPTPTAQVDEFSYVRGRKLPWSTLELDPHWQLAPAPSAEVEGNWRPRFQTMELLQSTHPESEFSLEFEGQAIGVYVLAGPDAGRLEVSVDGGEFQTVELFHRFSRGLHYPRTVMLADKLELGPHHAKIRIATDRHANSQGNAVRIIAVVAN